MCSQCGPGRPPTYHHHPHARAAVPGHPGPSHAVPGHPGPSHAAPGHPGPSHPGPGHPGPSHPGPCHAVPGHHTNPTGHHRAAMYERPDLCYGCDCAQCRVAASASKLDACCQCCACVSADLAAAARSHPSGKAAGGARPFKVRSMTLRGENDETLEVCIANDEGLCVFPLLRCPRLYILPALWFADLSCPLWFADLSCPFCGSRIYPACSVVRGILSAVIFLSFSRHLLA